MRCCAFLCFAPLALGCASGAGGDTTSLGAGASDVGPGPTSGPGSGGGAPATSSTGAFTTVTSTSTGSSGLGGGGLGGGGLGGAGIGGAGGSGTTSAAGGSGGASSTASSSATTTSGAGGAGGQGPTGTLIYAHDDTTLLQVDPTVPSLPLTTVGTFDCINNSGATGTDTAMTDIAVSATGALWGVSAHAVHPLTIQGTNVHCETQIAIRSSTARFYALTFAPVGVLSATDEVLVAGNSAGELWSIDSAGNILQHGKFGTVPHDDGHGHVYANAGKQWELSGDVVFLANSGSPVGYATVRDCPNPPSTSNCNKVNTLIEIDMTALAAVGTQALTKTLRGEIVTAPTCTDGLANNYGNMYGIATWDDKVYGFSRTGNLVQIELTDATACLVKNYPNKFAGAGVTTLGHIFVPPG